MHRNRLLPGIFALLLAVASGLPAAQAEETAAEETATVETATVETAAVETAAEEATPALDEIILTDGSRLLGRVTGARDGVVTLENDIVGTMEVPLDKVASMNTTAPAVVLLADETVVEETPLVISSEALLVSAADGTEQAYPLADIAVVNPEPWELGQGYRSTGLVNFAWALERGNSDTDELDYKLDSRWRSKRDRFTARLDGEEDKTNNTKSADNWQAQGKYDYFLTDPDYWGMQARLESDKFQDLDLRYLVGPYYGRQFYDTPLLTFSGELGAAYVNEDFIVADDQDYPAGVWSFEATSNYLGGVSRLYFDQSGIWNLDSTDDVIIDTTFGLAFPLLWNFEAAAEVILEYDSGAVEGVEELDETYNIRLGYTW